MIPQKRITSFALVSIILLSTLTLFIPEKADSLNGTILYVGGSGPHNFTSIQVCINYANPGDTIFICNGIYNESISVHKPLTIIGESIENTKITGAKDSDIITIITDNVSINSLTISNNQSGYGILIYVSENITITDCKVHSMKYIGIIIDDAKYVNISECDIVENNIRCIWILASNNVTLHNNIIFGNSWDGIMVNSSSDVIIKGNNIKGFQVGIGLCVSNNCFITENTISDNALQGIRSGYCEGNVTLIHNNFVNNSNHVGGIYNYTHWVWDNGYPSGGNYWSDYNGSDLYQGPYQDLSGNDGIGDTNYLLRDGKDKYPLFRLWTGKGDMDADCDIDVFDFDRFAQAWGGGIGYPCYQTRADFDDDLYIGVMDLDGFAQMWGKTYC